MDAGTLTILLDEMVDPADCDVTGLRIQYAAFSGSSNAAYVLTDSATSSDLVSRTINIALSSTDLNNIKLLTNLGTSIDNSFVSVGSSFISDMNNNDLTPINDGVALQASSFTTDTTRPTVKSFNLLTNGKMKLVFSESMQGTTFNASSFVLQDNSGELQYRLTNDYSSISTETVLSTVITLQLASDFVNAQDMGVGISQLTSYLFVNEYVGQASDAVKTTRSEATSRSYTRSPPLGPFEH